MTFILITVNLLKRVNISYFLFSVESCLIVDLKNDYSLKNSLLNIWTLQYVCLDKTEVHASFSALKCKTKMFLSFQKIFIHLFTSANLNGIKKV